MTSRHARLASAALLAAIFAVALALRLLGLGAHPHPDERVVLDRVNTLSFENLNPGFFIYPSFFMYQWALLEAGVAFVSGPSGLDLTAPRLLATFYSLATVALVFLMGRLVGGRAVGLWAAGLAAVFAPLVIQVRWALPDAPMIAFVTLTAFLTMLALDRNSPRMIFAATVVGGLAVSCKYSAAPILALPFFALIGIGRRRQWPWSRVLAVQATLPAIAVAAFLVTTPYALLDHETFVEDLGYEAYIQASGRGPGMHVAGREEIGFTDLALFGNADVVLDDLGPVATVLAALGLLASLGRGGGATPRSQTSLRILALWPLGYYVFMGTSVVATQKYMLPLYPALCIFAAAGAVRLGGYMAGVVGAGSARLRRAVPALLFVIAATPTAHASVRAVAALASPDTRDFAEAWFLENIPRPATLARGWFAPRFSPSPEGITVVSPMFSLTEQSLQSYCRQSVEYVITNSINRNLYFGPRTEHFVTERAWYDDLERHADLVKEFPGANLELHVPTIWIYRLRCPIPRERPAREQRRRPPQG